MTPQIPIDEDILSGNSGGFNLLVDNWDGYLCMFPVPVVLNKNVPAYYRKKFAHKWPEIIYN